MFCQSQTYPNENKPENQVFLAFFISKQAKDVEKSQSFKIWLQKSQIGNPATQELRMRVKYAKNLSIFVMYRSP